MDILKRKRRHLGRGSTGRTARLLIAALVTGMFLSIACAQSDPSEYQLKAAFLFNFTKFVEWPEGSFEDHQAPIVLGIIGDDPFGDDLVRMIAGEKVQGRRLVV